MVDENEEGMVQVNVKFPRGDKEKLDSLWGPGKPYPNQSYIIRLAFNFWLAKKDEEDLEQLVDKRVHEALESGKYDHLLDARLKELLKKMAE